MPDNKPKQEKAGNRRQNRLWKHTLVLGGVGLVFTLFFAFIQPFAFLQLWLSDQLFLAAEPSPNIVVVGIDDETLQTFGKWSDWTRDLHALALNNLYEAGAQVVGFDILFVDSSADDELLATVMAAAGNVVLPVAGTQASSSEGGVTYQSILVPVPPIREATANMGHANIIPDRDGKVRRLPLVISDTAGQQYPSFSLAVLYTMASMTLPDSYVRENGNLYLLSRDVPVDKASNLRIDFSPLPGDRPYLSYGDVITNDFDPAAVRNKIVIVGMTATGETGDTWEIPTSAEKVPGVFIQAAAMDTILRSNFLSETGVLFNLLIMLGLTVAIALVLPRLRIKWGALVIFVLFVAYLAISFLAFDRGRIMNLVYPPLLLVITFIGSVITMILMEQSDKRFVKDLFGRYVSPQVANQILSLADAGNLQLGGEQREATIMFADIRGFTKMSETMTPKEIVNMLNAHLGVAIDKVLANGGMVNKFAGDNIMAVWNAPQPQEEHARLACKAACEIQHGLAELQEKDPSLPKAQFGIGINTGSVVAGNVGSSGRTEYTVIGDAVNLASRICSATPATEIWIGPETFRRTKEEAECITLELQAFKGKAEQVQVYRLLSCR